MSELESSTAQLHQAVKRFDMALSRLEGNLNIAVEKLNSVSLSSPTDNNAPEDLVMREELANTRARELELEAAIAEAKSALSEAIDDIRLVLGPV